MLSFLKRVILYIYIVCTKYKQRQVVLDRLKHTFRPQRDIAYDQPGLPDAVDDTNGVLDGWSDFHSFQAFDKDGNCFHCSITNSRCGLKQVYLHVPTIGTLSYSETDGTVDGKDKSTTDKQRIKANLVDPMQKWNLNFRGHMKGEASDKGIEKTCFVRFNFYWKGTGDPYDFWLDTPPWQLAGQCSNMRLKDALTLIRSKSIWYEQWGELRGSLTIDDVESTIRMPSRRERKYIVGDDASENRIEFVKSHIIEVDRIAHRFSYTTLIFRSGKQLQFGNVIFPSLEQYYSNNTELTKYEEPDLKFKVTYCNKDVETLETAVRRLLLNENHKMTYTKYTMNGKQATGTILETNMRGHEQTRAHAVPKLNGKRNEGIETDRTATLVDLSDTRCIDKKLVGGKTANLSSLLAFGYNVPTAFCVTANVFKSVLQDNPDLARSFEHIDSVIREMKGNLKEACDIAVECFANCNVSENIISAIDEMLLEMTSLQNHGVAVRSSAVGEDGEILSAAGQLESILCVRNLEEVIKALKQCWSSYFTFQSVEYRRQNGQVIMDGMGVIIQEMIPSEVAGVLMTNDPLSGREDRLLINACLGLGEGVVSGKIDVDTFVIGLEDTGEFSILKETIGGKTKVIDSTSSGGIGFNDDSPQINPCLTKEWIYRLCNIGKSIEMDFKLEQEIEWAIFNDSLYILQTRPITSFEDDTEEDIFHEFDTPAISDIELYTTCNAQEMMPGATTPLTVSYTIRACSDACAYIGLHIESGIKRLYHPHGFVASCGNKMFLNMALLYSFAVNGIGGIKSKGFLEIDIVGAERDDVTEDDILDYKGSKPNTTLQMLKCYAKKMLISGPTLNRDFLQWEERMNAYVIGNESDDAFRLFQRINENRRHLIDTWRLYFHLLINPYASIIKGILMGGSKTFTQDNKEDLANILIKCGTVSADVPSALTRLANAIDACGLSKQFVQSSDEACLLVLTKTEQLKVLLEEFMKLHGHRGIREAEFFEKNWSQNPIKLVKALKSIMKNGVVERKDDDESDETKIADVLSNLKTNVPPFKRWIMKTFLLKRLLQKVVDRERGKSMVIKIIGAFKIAYWSLAKLMVKEGRLPEEDLLFFLTHREVGELFDTRSPRLIRKAKRRMKMFPRQQTTEYEQFSFGNPKRLTEQNKAHVEPLKPSVIIEGTPVGNGEATGRACIVRTEADVGNIRKGDILICQYTDIGWSPYFPLIAGLVTEIGSILSHGAVVARECGIPCVVNVKHATSLLQHDDWVRIHGSRGTIEKLPTS